MVSELIKAGLSALIELGGVAPSTIVRTMLQNTIPAITGFALGYWLMRH